MPRPAPAIVAALGTALSAGTPRADDSNDSDRGRELFVSAAPACATCHTLQAADATGEIGPILDDLRPDAARVEKAVRDGIGQMPAYRDTLSEEQIRLIAEYVARATTGT
jgi:sulfite dehydrogenase